MWSLLDNHVVRMETEFCTNMGAFGWDFWRFGLTSLKATFQRDPTISLYWLTYNWKQSSSFIPVCTGSKRTHKVGWASGVKVEWGSNSSYPLVKYSEGSILSPMVELSFPEKFYAHNPFGIKLGVIIASDWDMSYTLI